MTCFLKPKGGYLVAIFCYKTSWNSNNGFMLLQNGSRLALKTGAGIALQTDNAVFPVQNEKWHFLALRRNGSNWNIFLNGAVFKSSKEIKYISPASSCPLKIGGYNIHTNNIFNGLIDEVTLYNRTLSDNELFDLMASKI